LEIPYRVIFWAGLVCGLLDGLSATVVSSFFGTSPIRLFQGIASGLLGRSAFEGGTGTALMGVALHFVVALGASTVYYAASRLFPVLIDQALACGVAYGIAVHLFMTFVVIPLSAIGRRPFVALSFLTFLFVSMIVVGPSVALTIRHFSRSVGRD
jgi:uncharacterized membrane protein YagU involved in acid resistance